VEVIALMPQSSKGLHSSYHRITNAQYKALQAQRKAWNARITLLANFAAQAAQNRISTTPLHIVEHWGNGEGWWHHYHKLNFLRSGWAPTTYKVVLDDSILGKLQIGLYQFYLNRGLV